MIRKREKNRKGTYLLRFFAQHSILDNFSRVNVVKILNPSQKKVKVPTQNTPQIFEIFHLTPQKNCRDQRKLTIVNPRNSFQATLRKLHVYFVWTLNGIAHVSHTDVQYQARNSWCWYIALTIELLINTPCSSLGLFVI